MERHARARRCRRRSPRSPRLGPAGGYLPLSLFGIAPIAGVGDDTITNFNVPTFFYGGEPYTRLGVVSNGYLVLGGGDSGDIVFTPQHFPNAARPNNVVAPLWTDLNPAGRRRGPDRHPDRRRLSTWLVVDWAGVKNFGNATTHSFEIWLRVASGGAGTGPSSEEITFTYGTGRATPGNAGSGDPDSGQNWGAENRTGTSGVNIAPAPAERLGVPGPHDAADRGRRGVDHLRHLSKTSGRTTRRRR